METVQCSSGSGGEASSESPALCCVATTESPLWVPEGREGKACFFLRAERVLNGKVPHLDIDGKTGSITFLATALDQFLNSSLSYQVRWDGKCPQLRPQCGIVRMLQWTSRACTRSIVTLGVTETSELMWWPLLKPDLAIGGKVFQGVRVVLAGP